MIRRVAAAFLAVDGFRGVPITDGSVWVKSADGASPVRKQEGIYVFWDNGQSRREFELGGAGYFTQRVTADVRELSERGLPLLRVYLMPDPSYPFPAKTRWRELLSEPQSQAEAVWEGTEGIVRLCQNIGRQPEGGGIIFLKKPENFLLEDRRLAIREKGGESEIFLLGEKADSGENGYRLKTELRHSYRASESEILLVYPAVADSRGYVKIPILP